MSLKAVLAVGLTQDKLTQESWRFDGAPLVDCLLSKLAVSWTAFIASN